MIEGIAIAAAMLLGAAGGAWWTERTMRYNQDALTQGVTLAGSIASTQAQIIADLREQQRHLLAAVTPKPKQTRVKAEPTNETLWTPLPVANHDGNGHEKPPKNTQASRIEV